MNMNGKPHVHSFGESMAGRTQSGSGDSQSWRCCDAGETDIRRLPINKATLGQNKNLEFPIVLI